MRGHRATLGPVKFWVFDPPMMIGPWAFAELVDPVYGAAPRCQACGTFIDNEPWQSPYRIRLIKGKETNAPADVITGPGFGGFIASQRFVTDFERANLRGIERWERVEIEGYSDDDGNPLSSPAAPAGIYNLAILPVPTTRAKWEEMRMVFRGGLTGCELCGRRGRLLDSYEGAVIDEPSWTGADIFQVAHNADIYIATESFVEFVAVGEFTGVPLVPAAEFLPS
jgi:hypothetical protein